MAKYPTVCCLFCGRDTSNKIQICRNCGTGRRQVPPDDREREWTVEQEEAFLMMREGQREVREFEE